MHDMTKRSINALVLLGLFSSSLVEAVPAISSSNSNPICGKVGSNGSQKSFLSTSYCNSWAYCQSACELHSGCQSFAYFNGPSDDTGGDCKLYTVPVQGNFVANSSSTYKFYDKSCMAAEKQCNVKGYSKIDSFEGFDAKSMSDCATPCSGYNQQSTGCASYAFGEGSCQLYSYLLVDNVDVDTTSDFIFNDALCSQPVSTTTTTTTTKSTGKTTATTTTKAPSAMTTTTTTKTAFSTTIKSTSATKTTTTSKSSSTTTTTKASSATTTAKVASTTKSTTTTKASSKTTTTSTVASNAAASNSPQCAVAGWHRTDPIFEFSVDSLSSCGDFCYDYSGGSTNCVAYAYSDEGDCRLFNSSVADGVWVTSTSEFKNYDLACPASPTTIKTTTTTTTNKAGHTTTTMKAPISTTSTTTKSSSQTSATTTTSATSSTTPQCGVSGWGREDPFLDFSDYSLSSCADFCSDYSTDRTDSTCRSWAFSPDAMECRLYNTTVADNVYVSSDSDYSNYDLACGDPTTISTSTKATATTTKKPSQTSASTSAPQCSVIGWGRATAFFDYIGDTLQECAQACYNNRGAPNYCQSYSYGYTGHECRLYSNVSVADNVYVNSGADFGNYDLPCYNASLNLDPSVCTPGYHNAQCDYKQNYDASTGDAGILNSFDDCVIRCNSITNCRYVVWYRKAAQGVPQNTCVVLRAPVQSGGVALDGVDSASRF